MAGQWGYQAQHLGKNTKNKKKYDYSNISSGGDTSRYYSFSIKEHYDEVAKNRTFKVFKGFLDTAIAAQEEREKTQLSILEGINNTKDLEAALLSASSNGMEILSSLLLDYLVDEQGWEPRQKLYKEGEFKNIINNIEDRVNELIEGLDSNLQSNFLTKIKNGEIPNLQLAKNSSTGVQLAAPKDFFRQNKEGGEYTSKTKLKKVLDSGILKNLRAELFEHVNAEALQQISGMVANVTGREKTGANKFVKADISGIINLSSKFYTIKSPTSITPITLHGSTLQGIGEYLGNYGKFSKTDVDNFIFNFVNIYNFAVSGGIEKNESGNTVRSFGVGESGGIYEQIILAVQNAAAIWIGTSLLGKKNSQLFTGEHPEYNNVDFLFINNQVIAVSDILKYIRNKSDSIEIQFNTRRIMNAEEVYQNKLQAGRSATKGTNKSKETFYYPEPVLKVGRQYGKAAAGASADIKFMFIVNNFK